MNPLDDAAGAVLSAAKGVSKDAEVRVDVARAAERDSPLERFFAGWRHRA